MKKLYIISSIVLAFALISCQKDEVLSETQTEKEKPVAENCIYAELPDNSGVATKTHLEPDGVGKYQVVWDEGDMIAVRGQEGTATYRLVDGAGTRAGKFEYYSGVTRLTGPYTAYSPSTMCESDGRIVWPAIQTYISTGMIAGAPMQASKEAGESLNEPFKFKNMGGIIRFTLKRAEGASAQSVKSLSVSTADGAVYTLSCKNAIDVPEGANGVEFYMALPVGKYENLRFEFATTGNSRLTLTAKKAISIVRSEISSVTKTAANSDWEKEEDLKWVDLGLPSGLLWANKNLGATNSTSQGDYYFWGETTPWFTYDATNKITWENTQYQQATTSADKWNNTSNMKNINFSLVGYFKRYDVAYLRTGVGQMPSSADWQELKDNTNMTTVTVDGVKCLKFTSKKDTTFILVPYAGRLDISRNASSIYEVGGYAEYMTSSYKPSTTTAFLSAGYVGGNWKSEQGYDRYRVAVPVRAVRQTQDIQFIDLGLSVLWADRNLGATSAIGKQSYGTYYMWGYTDLDPVSGYDPTVSNQSKRYTKWNGTWDGAGALKFGGKYNPADGKTKLENIDDAAWVASNGEYRMPTVAELEELLQYTKQTDVSSNPIKAQYGGVNGKVLTSKVEGYTNQSIFLPAAGNNGAADYYTRITSCELQTGAATSWPYGPVMELYNRYRDGGTTSDLKMTQQGQGNYVGAMRYAGLIIRPVKDKPKSN